jgi:hypothetical protein
VGEVGNAVEFDFQRHGDLLLDFFSGVTGPLRDDLDVGVGDVGIGFDGEIVKRDDAPNEQQDCETQDEDSVI